MILCCSIFLVTGCKKETPVPDQMQNQGQKIAPEEAFPNEKGEVFSFSCGNYEHLHGKNVFEGDIILTEEQLKYKRERGENQDLRGAAMGLLVNRWPRHIVYYTIRSEVQERYRIFDAMDHWKQNTNVRFIPRTNQPNYVEFIEADGCWSYLGMIGGKQQISLAPGCHTGIAIHEIGHAVGLFHEQSRSDRDAHVNILWDNIEPGREGNFTKFTDQGYVGFNFGAFDYNSIMMYGPYYWSINGLPTITKKDGSTFDIQRSELSNTDKNVINYGLYPTKFIYNRPTSMDNVNLNQWKFTFGDWNNDSRPDLIAIHFTGTGSGKMKCLILSGASNFQNTLFNQEINLNAAAGDWEFEVGNWNNDGRLDLFAIHKNNNFGVNKTRISALSGASNFNTRFFTQNTVLDETYSNWEFEMGNWDGDTRSDLIAIKKNGSSNKTEVLVLSGNSNYQSIIQNTQTRLWSTNSDYMFDAGDWNNTGKTDLVAIRWKNTQSKSVEVRAMNGDNLNGNFLRTAPSVHWETGNNYSFHFGDWNGNSRKDVFSIQASNPGGKVFVRIFEVF